MVGSLRFKEMWHDRGTRDGQRRDREAPRMRMRGGDPLLGGRPSAPGHAGRAGGAAFGRLGDYPSERPRRLP